MSPITYRNFPLRLYQITSKFRDEMKPRFGLIRAKEFLMKDMYTFDLDLNAAKTTYEQVNEQYSKFFEHLKIPYHKITADTGVMGGKISHEYHILAPIGEDQIVRCPSCAKVVNKELCQEDGSICEKCDKSSLERHQGIEIAHTFILEDKYSKALSATYLDKTGKPAVLQMGCYGIGVTRLLSASIENLSSESGIRWPEKLAPFRVCIIPPKEGSKEESAVKHLTEVVHGLLEANETLKDDVVVDDRLNMTIGKRMKEAQKLGIPFIVVIGSKAAGSEPKLEVFHVNSNSTFDLSVPDAISHIVSHVKSE
jgi:prolyl-tRNA synthetase